MLFTRPLNLCGLVRPNCPFFSPHFAIAMSRPEMSRPDPGNEWEMSERAAKTGTGSSLVDILDYRNVQAEYVKMLEDVTGRPESQSCRKSETIEPVVKSKTGSVG